jgi:hypothetical protein
MNIAYGNNAPNAVPSILGGRRGRALRQQEEAQNDAVKKCDCALTPANLISLFNTHHESLVSFLPHGARIVFYLPSFWPQKSELMATS